MKKIYLFIVLAMVPLISMCSGSYGPMRDGYGGYGMGPGMMGEYSYGYGAIVFNSSRCSDLLYCSKCKIEE